MEERKTSTLSNGFIWFGAAISIAEIMTGTLIAPLGMKKGIIAILLGHAIGCLLFYFAGLIGAKTGDGAMETVRRSFGKKGAILFSSLNVLQLVGWTAIMILTGAVACNTVFVLSYPWLWSFIIGGFVVLWVAVVGTKSLERLNAFAVGALFILTIGLSILIFKGKGGISLTDGLSFGSALELSVAMPLSWLPLISDYTRNGKNPIKATKVSTLAYFLGSSWMYIIGMGAAIYTGETDIAKIMVTAGFGVFAILIIVFSTVTTTFLDAYSAGVSAESIFKGFKEKPVAIGVGIIGVFLAVFTPITELEGFLFLIGSVFAPMIAILLADFFILKRDSSLEGYNVKNLSIWFVGFVIYRLFIGIDIGVGSSIPVVLIVIGICLVFEIVFGGWQQIKNK